MIHILYHNFRFWKVLIIGAVLIGLMLVATKCGSEPPIGSGITFTFTPPGPVPPGAKIAIQVNVKNDNGHEIDNYWWVVRVGEGSIVNGQGTPLITYKAPENPGTYQIHVELEYESGQSVKGSTIVEVVSGLTLTTGTPTLTSTGTPSPVNTPRPLTTTMPTEEPTGEATTELAEEPTGEPTEEPTPKPSTPTPEPPTETPKPDAVVKAEALNLRSGPGVVYDILGVLTRGDCLDIKCKCPADKWLEVDCLSRGLTGWVNASLLEINRPLASVPVASVIPPTPTPVHTPTPVVTPTPTLLPPPILTEPENGAAFIGEPAVFRWQWDRPLAPGEVFSVRVHREGETKLCHHAQARDLEYKGSLSYCTAGTHYWGVTLALRLCGDETKEHCWQSLSEPSEERWFYYVPPDEPWTWPTPPGKQDDDEGLPFIE